MYIYLAQKWHVTDYYAVMFLALKINLLYYHLRNWPKDFQKDLYVTYLYLCLILKNYK